MPCLSLLHSSVFIVGLVRLEGTGRKGDGYFVFFIYMFIYFFICLFIYPFMYLFGFFFFLFFIFFKIRYLIIFLEMTEQHIWTTDAQPDFSGLVSVPS